MNARTQLALASGHPCGPQAQAWAHVRTVALCTPAALARALALLPASSSELEEALAETAGAVVAPATDVYPFDHVHPESASRAASAEEAGGRRVVLYGAPGSQQLRDMHEAVLLALRSPAQTQSQLQYVLRLVPADAASEGFPTRVPGFGVVLDIKNMEYKALDDRAISEVRAGAGGAGVRCARAAEHA